MSKAKNYLDRLSDDWDTKFEKWMDAGEYGEFRYRRLEILKFFESISLENKTRGQVAANIGIVSSVSGILGRIGNFVNKNPDSLNAVDELLSLGTMALWAVNIPREEDLIKKIWLMPNGLEIVALNALAKILFPDRESSRVFRSSNLNQKIFWDLLSVAGASRGLGDMEPDALVDIYGVATLRDAVIATYFQY